MDEQTKTKRIMTSISRSKKDDYLNTEEGRGKFAGFHSRARSVSFVDKADVGQSPHVGSGLPWQPSLTIFHLRSYSRLLVPFGLIDDVAVAALF